MADGSQCRLSALASRAGCEHLPQVYEGADHLNAGAHRHLAPQDVRRQIAAEHHPAFPEYEDLAPDRFHRDRLRFQFRHALLKM